MSARGGLTTALRHRDYRYLISGFALSMVGSWAYQVGLTVWLYQSTGSLGWVAAATVAKFVPGLLLSPYAGVLADRFEKVSLLRTADLVCTALMALIAVLVTVDAPAALVVALSAVTFTVMCVHEPAAAGLTPTVVPERDLASANALRNVVDNVAIIAGPAIGAAFLAFGPVEVAIWLNAASFLGSAYFMWRIRTRSTAVDVTEGGAQGPVAQMLVGVRAIFSSLPVAVMVGYCLLATMLYGADTVLFVAISDRLLGTGSDGYGYLLAGLGVGGVLAAPLVTRAGRLPSLAPVIIGGMAAYCLPTLVVLVTGVPAVAFAAEAVRGAGTMFVDVLAITSLQRALPNDVLSRVFGAFESLLRAVVLVGAGVASWLIAAGSVQVAVWVASAGAFTVALAGLPWLAQLDRRARARREALAPRVALIEACDLLAEVPDGGLTELAGAADQVTVAAGEPVVREGEPADAFYVVVSGRLGVLSTAGGAPVRVPELGPGDYFGELGLLEGIPRTATVTAATEAEVLRIDGADFLEVLNAGQPSAAVLDRAALRLSRTHPALAVRKAGLTPDPS